MTDETSTLIALGASAAVNCRPCLDHHLAAGRSAGLADADIAAAIEVGLAVNQGAARQTRSFVDSLLGAPTPAAGEAVPAAAGTKCC